MKLLDPWTELFLLPQGKPARPLRFSLTGVILS